jgi:PAS domain S-box-containing protein
MDSPVSDQGGLGTAAERIELALDSGAILGTWVWDVVSDRVTADERFARSFGLDAALCERGLPLTAVTASIHDEDRPRVEGLIADALSRGGRFSAEYRVRQYDGVYRWIEASGRCHLDANSRPTRFPGVLVDIDERKHAEERLRRSESEAREASQLLRAVIEAVPALIYVKDRQGRMKLANGPVLDLIGKPWSEVEGRGDAEFLDNAEEGRIIMATDQRLMATGQTQELEEVVGGDAFGPRTWLSNKRAFRDEEGVVIGLVGASVEITARKRAEEQRQLLLLELNHRVKNLFALACGMVTMSARSAKSPRDMAEGLTGRLIALSQAHELIHPAIGNVANDQTTGLEQLILSVVSPHLPREASQLRISGPPISLIPAAATALALILYELSTNAAKYGALSRAEGHLDISWRLDAAEFILDWTETDGPPIESPPTRVGFGSTLARRSATGSLGGEIEFAWERTGLRATLKAKPSLLHARAAKAEKAG